jgi:hypothetical protein
MHVRLCGDEYVVVSLDIRTGRLALRDMGGLSAAGRAQRLAVLADRVNENPPALLTALAQLRISVCRLRVRPYIVLKFSIRPLQTMQSKQRAILVCGVSEAGTSLEKVWHWSLYNYRLP